MIKISIVVFDYALAAAAMGMSDMLYFAGNIYQRQQRQREPRFQVRLASRDGQPVKVMNNLSITPHCSLQDIEDSDVVLLPNITGEIDLTLTRNSDVIELLQRLQQRNCIIGCNSTGVFFAAEAGLLDGRQATTLWSAVDDFRERYPKVDLRPDQLLTVDGNLICDAGGTSWFDLGLHLIELFCGHRTAMDTAKYFMVDLERSTQLSFSPLASLKYHGDKTILEIQHWLEAHYREAISMDDLGHAFGLSNRSLLRRFKLATGLSPLSYLQDIRLDMACRLLVQSNKSVEEVTHEVGYEDVSSFIRLFKRRSGFTPNNYRARFRAVHVAR
ncbi:MAG: GlxA family transcriptional regulator [Candidatus Pelagadaptatus aseana]|uniref:GlxA family transcriptional regulator n=1 Tax=Candidatus Pelagadaptatus aseana TaxID=3120508 RepID=UPI0039B2EE23